MIGLRGLLSCRRFVQQGLRTSPLSRPASSRANFKRPNTNSKLAKLSPKEKFDLIQKRKHKPRMPASLRNRKRILVLDSPDDIPRELQKLKDAMYAGADSLALSTLQNHWSSLFNFTYKALFEQLERKKRPKGRKLKMAQLGMPPQKQALLEHVDSSQVAHLEECFSHLSKSFHPTATTYTMMMTMYERLGQAEKSVLLFERMKREGVKPDLFAFNAVVKAHGACGNSAEAVYTLDELFASGLRPDVITYTNLIQIFGQEQDTDAMMKAYDMMEKHNVRPTVVTLSVLVNGLCKAGKVRQAVAVFDDFKSLQIKPNEFAFNAMIMGVARYGDVKQARRYLVKMAEAGLQPNNMTFKAMINSFVVKGSHFTDGYNLHAAVLQGGFGAVTPCDDTYDLLLNMYGNSLRPNIDTGLDLYREAVHAGCFGHVKALKKDRINLVHLKIGTVPFAVQNALFEYVDLCHDLAKSTKEELLGKNLISGRGLLFICGNTGPRTPVTECSVQRPTEKLRHTMLQEQASVLERVEAELLFLEVKYHVDRTGEGEQETANVVIPRDQLIVWALKYTKIRKPRPKDTSGVGSYVYKRTMTFANKTAQNKLIGLVRAPGRKKLEKAKQRAPSSSSSSSWTTGEASVSDLL